MSQILGAMKCARVIIFHLGSSFTHNDFPMHTTRHVVDRRTVRFTKYYCMNMRPLFRTRQDRKCPSASLPFLLKSFWTGERLTSFVSFPAQQERQSCWHLLVRQHGPLNSCLTSVRNSTDTMGTWCSSLKCSGARVSSWTESRFPTVLAGTADEPYKRGSLIFWRWRNFTKRFRQRWFTGTVAFLGVCRCVVQLACYVVLCFSFMVSIFLARIRFFLFFNVFLSSNFRSFVVLFLCFVYVLDAFLIFVDHKVAFPWGRQTWLFSFCFFRHRPPSFATTRTAIMFLFPNI